MLCVFSMLHIEISLGNVLLHHEAPNMYSMISRGAKQAGDDMLNMQHTGTLGAT